MIAAIWSLPSHMIWSSRNASARGVISASVSPKLKRWLLVGFGVLMNPGAAPEASSVKFRRKSPVAWSAPGEPPWYERYWLMILVRPVKRRAMRMAASFASDPPFGKRNPFRSPGRSSERSCPSRTRTSVLPRPP